MTRIVSLYSMTENRIAAEFRHYGFQCTYWNNERQVHTIAITGSRLSFQWQIILVSIIIYRIISCISYYLLYNFRDKLLINQTSANIKNSDNNDNDNNNNDTMTMTMTITMTMIIRITMTIRKVFLSI